MGDGSVKCGWMCKLTMRSSLVVRRRVALYDNGVFYTYHDFDKQPDQRKAWYLSGRCRLSPVEDLEVAHEKHVRPHGAW
jgi:hypothetical protein